MGQVREGAQVRRGHRLPGGRCVCREPSTGVLHASQAQPSRMCVDTGQDLVGNVAHQDVNHDDHLRYQAIATASPP
jgi:hypothetical protein